MTTLVLVEEQISKFLKSETSEVFAIKGAWGVGKTYFWDGQLRKNKDDISKQKYSYVSLFGLNSIEELKFAIFEKSIKRDAIGTEPSVETFRENILGQSTRVGKWGIGYLSSVFQDTKISKFARDAFTYLSLSEMLICIDDLERTKINFQEILGLISELKERRNCKIVLIFNEEKIGDQKEVYKEYREKVIDREIEFTPTAMECANIAIDGVQFEYLRERCCAVDIRNIRILKKIKSLWLEAQPHLEILEIETKRNFESTLVLMCNSFYASSDIVPTLDFIREFSTNLSLLRNSWADNAKLTEEDLQNQRWSDFLSSFDYNGTDELDLEIADSISRGFYLTENLKLYLHKYNENILVHKKDQTHTEAWRIYHNSFDNDAAELVCKMVSSTKSHISNISQINLSSSLKLLRDLGADTDADSLIELAINTHEEAAYFDLENFQWPGQEYDEAMLKRFKEAFEIKSPCLEPMEALETLTSGQGWSDRDLYSLTLLDVDGFVGLFKNDAKGEKLSDYIKHCLRLGKTVGINEDIKLIGDKVENALKIISNESVLNRRRVAKFGISLDN